MNPISLILLNIIYKPIFNLIVILLALLWSNLWLAIIWLTLIVRLILLKPSLAANNMQKWMVDMQPRLKEIQEKHKDDPKKMGEETMKLFKTSWNNPLKGCKMLLIQTPTFIWLFYVIRAFAQKKESVDNIYSFIHPFINIWFDKLNHIFLWIDLFAHAGWAWFILAVIAWILMYTQIKLTMLNKPTTPAWGWANIPWMPKIPDMSKMMWYMNIFIVLMMASFVYWMPAGIWIYIITSTLFTITQYSIQYKELIKVKLNIALSSDK